VLGHNSGLSMFEDNIAFTLMALKAAPWAARLPVKVRITAHDAACGSRLVVERLLALPRP